MLILRCLSANIRHHIAISCAATSSTHADFFLLPGSTPYRKNILEPGDLVTYITLPPLPSESKSVYLKLRDRASYEFALASAAVVLRGRDGRFEAVQIAMGGIGAIPWRARPAEALLTGASVDPAKFRAAAEAVLKDARPQSENGFAVSARSASQASPPP